MALYRLPADEQVPPTPFYYYDMGLLRRTLEKAISEASRYGYHVHYALKANVEGPVLDLISSCGLGADCVSGWEVQAAVEHGFAPDKIVFAGVGKSDAEIVYALEQGIFAFNCESLEELEVINRLAASLGVTATVALRINPDVEPDTHTHISTGQAESKFGISYTEVDKALEKINSLGNIHIVGLHFHIGSQIRNLDSFRRLALRANELVGWFASKGVTFEHLNMGGGLGIDYRDPDDEHVPDFAGYFRVFDENLKVREGQTVHFELGRSIVGQCGELVTKALYTKESPAGSKYVIVDAGFTELLRPALYGSYHKLENISAEGEGRPAERYYVGGPICESSDIFARDIDLPLTRRGDYIAIRSAGAYGSIMSSHYNMRPTAKAYFDETPEMP